MSRSEPHPVRWTRDEYFRMSEAGYFNDRRVELIGGEIVEMAAQYDLHGAAITLTQDALRVAFGPGHWVRTQMTLDLSPHGVPDPDLAVVPGSPRGAGRTDPQTDAGSTRRDCRPEGKLPKRGLLSIVSWAFRAK